MAGDRGVDRRVQRGAVGILHQLARPPAARAPVAEQHDETGIGQAEPALPVDRGDRHRRVVEEAREAHLGDAPGLRSRPSRMSRTSVRDAPTVPSGADRHAMEEPDRQPRAVGAHEVDVERLRLAASRACRLDDRQALDGDDVADMRGAGLELGEVDADPLGERCIQIADAPVRLEREEAGRRVVEVVDRVLQLLKNVLLVLALAGDVGDQPAGARRRLRRRG